MIMADDNSAIIFPSNTLEGRSRWVESMTATVSDQPLVLSQTQIERFWRDGFIVSDRVIDGELLTRLRGRLDRLVSRVMAESTQNLDFRFERGTTNVIRTIDNFIRYGEEWWELIKYPAIVGAVRDLLGNEVYLHGTKLQMKPPLEGSAKEWHQDLAEGFLTPRDQQRLTEMGPSFQDVGAPMVAVQVYLDDSTEKNGCLEFVPGSHKWGLLETDKVLASFSPEQIVKVPAQAGSAAIFHCLVLHYSSPNRSPHGRRGPIAEYFAPSTLYQLPEIPNCEGFGVRLV